MECPKCGDQMDDSATECPRCAEAAQAPEPPSAAVPELPSVAAPASGAVPESSPGPLPEPPPVAAPPPPFVPVPGTPPSYAQAQPYAGAGYADASLPPRTSGLAIASLICGVCGLCTCGISSIVGLVLGIIALVQIQKNPRQLTGQGLAIAGLVVSALFMFILPISALIVTPRMVGASRKAKESSLKGNLMELRNGLAQFQADTGSYPNSLTDLVDTQNNPPTTGEDGAGGTGVKIPAGSYKGPYLATMGGIDNSGIPINPFAPIPTGTLSTDLPANWNYSQGLVHPAVPTTGCTLDGIPYQQL